MNGNVRQTAPELTWGTLRVTCDNSPTADGTGPQKAPEGTEDMNSIDNLREYVLTAPSICSTTRAILVGYIDNIEREVADMVPLPLDADGVPIHVGDVMELAGGDVEKVESMHNYGNEGWSVTTTHNVTVIPWSARHYRAPTVEDVLREFYVYAERGKEHHREDVDDAVLAEYAAKLALRGDE